MSGSTPGSATSALAAEAPDDASSPTRLRRLLDGLFCFVGLLDPDGIVLEANRTALDGAGLERHDVIGQPFWETPWWGASPEVRAQLRDAIRRARLGETVRYDVEICLAGDARVTMDFQLVPLVEDGQVTGLVPSGIDVTDRRTDGERLLAFAEFAQALAVAAHAADVAAAVRTHLSTALGAVFSSLALVEPGSRLAFVLHPPDLDPVLAERYAAVPLTARTPLTDAIRLRTTVVVENAAVTAMRYPQLIEDREVAGVASTVAIPLEIAGEVCGAIGLGWTRPLDIDEPFLARLRTVGQLVAQTLERARTSDTRAAFIAQVQASMLPAAGAAPHLDVATCYQAAGTGLGFGGDWHDIIAVDDARTAVVVGDVVGHGIEAAATMVLVRSAINAVIQVGTPVADIFSVTGPVFNAARNSYIGTAVVLVIDPVAQRIDYSRAGHPPVLVVDPDGTTTLLEGARGIVLGYRERTPEACSVPFAPGALAVAYTDGLIETRTGSIDEGIERLRAVVVAGQHAGCDARTIGERLIASLGDITHLDDDVALVVVRNTYEPAE